jgi:hypothetical protein
MGTFQAWTVLILILLVAGSVYVESGRSNALVLDSLQYRDLVGRYGAVLKLAREEIAIDNQIIEAMYKTIMEMQKHIDMHHGQGRDEPAPTNQWKRAVGWPQANHSSTLGTPSAHISPPTPAP